MCCALRGQFVDGFDGVVGVRHDGIHFSAEGSLWLARTHGAEILDAGTGTHVGVTVRASG